MSVVYVNKCDKCMNTKNDIIILNLILYTNLPKILYCINCICIFYIYMILNLAQNNIFLIYFNIIILDEYLKLYNFPYRYPALATTQFIYDTPKLNQLRYIYIYI